MEQRRLAGHEGIVKSTRSTLLVMVCTISSRILGFLRVAVIGAVFGADGKADVLNAVFTIPNNLRKLLAEGALSSAFIPVLSETIENEEHPKRSVEITRSILAFQWLVLVPIVLLSIVFAGPTTGVLIDFPEPERMQLSVDVFRWFIIYLFLISTSAVLMGVLHAHDIFFVPALTPILFSVSVIISIFMFHDELGVFSMVIGVLVGGVAQILFQFPRYKKKGYSLFPRFNFKDPAFRRIIRQWLPVVATASVFTINQQVAVRFATGLENGSASALSNALVFWQLPFGIFSASITTVLFPKMSREFTRNDYKNLRATVTYGLRFLFVLLIPSSIVLMFQGAGIISVTLQRGAFTAANTSMAADVLLY
ncbi:MAG: murein biosynthesis integral membrane protein MurJ, partial [Spirochaetales bacterium]|nr:murein biosynthesis integral membrane protein MurJ [Spirochaetales bacterium]MCF7938853.1 murein biosynthesis integral membrane protein MurJ [Spirochaetales bacterium]